MRGSLPAENQLEEAPGPGSYLKADSAQDTQLTRMSIHTLKNKFQVLAAELVCRKNPMSKRFTL